MLFYGNDAVRASEENLYVGEFVCTISDAVR